MSKDLSRLIVTFEIIFLCFISLLFLKLGSDTLEYPEVRIFYFILIFTGLLCLFRTGRLTSLLKDPAFMFFAAFFLFELFRAVRAVELMHLRGAVGNALPTLQRHVESLKLWFLYLGFFSVSFLLFRTRQQAVRLLWLLSGLGFILAMTAIPPLLVKHSFGYVDALGQGGYFPPVVYTSKFVSKYLVSHYAHVNYVGDIIALGFFGTTGIFSYSLQQWIAKRRSDSIGGSGFSLNTMAMQAVFAGVQGAAIVLMLSRATIICFVLALFILLAATFAKNSPHGQGVIVGVILVVVAGFVLWTADIPATWKKVGTAKEEVISGKDGTSFGTNREAARRVIRIYRRFPVWGVGREGYASISNLFSTPGAEKYVMRDAKAFCHYLQILAEEGMGAYLYFLFILAYFCEMFLRLLRMKSRFQFVAGLSLSSVVLMILTHAATKPVMEYFAIASPVYILMGASLAIVKQDFPRA